MWAYDTNYCISAGLEAGNWLQLWECDGSEAQSWGYNSEAHTFSLTASSPELCVDIPGSAADNGRWLWVWDCDDGVANQQFQSLGVDTLTMDLDFTPSAGCSSSPSPLPSPAPSPVLNVWPTDRCQGEQTASTAWPKFNSAAELEADSIWASYFQTVYGDIPQDGYPICTSSLTLIVTSALSSAGLSPTACSDGQDPGTWDYVQHMAVLSDPPGASYIWNSQNIGHTIPSDTWVEITHSPFGEDGAIGITSPRALQFGSTLAIPSSLRTMRTR